MDISLPPAHVTMRQWNIVVIVHEGQTIEKFLGYSVYDEHYRISSQVLEYDEETKRGMTTSGSVYVFLDEPGKLHPLAQQVFDKLDALEKADVSLKFQESHDQI